MDDPDPADEFLPWREALARALKEQEAERALRPRKHPGDPYDAEEDPASGWLEAFDFEAPSADEGINEDVPRRVSTYSRQVGIRLSQAQYRELCSAADLYGLAPGTMARMLVRRGARAVLDSRRRYDLEQGDFD